MTPTKLLIGQILVVFAIMTLGLWAATQWAAAMLGLPAGARSALVHDPASCRVYRPWALFAWWYHYRGLCAGSVRQGRSACRRQRLPGLRARRSAARCGGRGRAGNVTTYGSARWAAYARDRGRRPVRRAAACSSASFDGALSSPRRPRACHGLRADAERQGRRPGRSDPSQLDRLGGHPRHQGRELAADRRLALALLALPAVQSDRRALGALQSAARGPARQPRGARRPEHRRHPGRSGRRARAAQPLGEDEPLAAGRRDPPRPLCRGGEDPGAGRDLPVRPGAAVRCDPAGDDDHQPSRHGRGAAGPSGRRLRRARAAQQVRERALGRAFDRHVVPRPVPRPDRRRGDVGLRLAHRRPCRRRASGLALPGRARRRTSRGPSRWSG